MNSDLKIHKFSHFLLDYDVLLVDSEKLYFETWCLVLTEKGQKVCHDFHEGKHEGEVYEKVKSFLTKPMTLEEISSYRKSMYDQLVSENKLELFEGIPLLL